DRTAAELAAGKGIVLGEALAINQLQAYPGDTVRVVNIYRARQEYQVLGTFSVGNLLIDGVTAFVSIPSLQAYLNSPGLISGYHVRVAHPDDAQVVASRLSRTYGLFATTWQAIFSNLVEQLRLQKALISAVVFLIVLVAALGIANILIVTVAEKTEEIAVLRAMGASERQVLAVFTLEGLLLGGTGTLLGALLGLSLGLYFQAKPFPLPGDLYYITQLPVAFQAQDFLWVCGLSLVTSTLAGLIPARRAANLDPATILR
ncbi:MAG TPA: FtsX-like permease family protein, partial [Trueperaceae bacterium]